MKYNNQEVLRWYEDYKDYRVSVNTISQKYKIKNWTMIARFKKLGLKIRPAGFRVNNCRGKDGEDNIRLRYLWFFKFNYKRRAARKGFEVTLQDDEFIKLVTSDCHYCGKSWRSEERTCNGKQVKMLTIDRKDSSKGYNFNNCVSSCKRCNTIKMDMSYEEFIERIKAIHSHLKL